MAREYDHLFKLLITGDYDTYITTIDVDFEVRTFGVNGERVKLRIWDTDGHGRFHIITSVYFRGTHGVVVVYDVTNSESFANVRRWLHEIDSKCDVVNRILVGNKNDDLSRKVVMTEDAEAFAQEKGMMLFETSAKENLNVEEMFLAITAQMLQTKEEQQKKEAEQPTATISLTDKSIGGKKYYCF